MSLRSEGLSKISKQIRKVMKSKKLSDTKEFLLFLTEND